MRFGAVVLTLIILVGTASRAAPEPAESGSYAVGMTTRELVRASSTTGHPRTLVTTIWYPATTSDVDAPADVAGAPYPLVILSHGWTSSPSNYSQLATYVASYGFVVAAPLHPDCGQPCELQYARNKADHPDALANRPADVSFVIDQLVDLESNGDALFAGLADTSRVGLMGHSTGGWTVLTTAETDSRFRAVLAMAPTERLSAWQTVVDGAASLNGAVLLLVGQRDTHATFSLVDRMFWALSARSDPSPSMEVVFPRAGHWIYIDFCPSGDPNCSADRLPEEQGQNYVRHFAAAFLLHFLADDTRFDTWLDPTVATGDPEFQIVQH